MLNNILDSMQKHKKNIWVMYNNEGSDKYFSRYISDKIETLGICIISKNKTYVISHELDCSNINDIKYSDNKIVFRTFKNNNELDEIVEDVIADLNFPNEISLSYSTIGDKATDILSHGDYIYITKLLRKPYKKYSKRLKFSSAENIIYDIASKKNDKQIFRLKVISNITVKILEETIKKIKVGMSEIDIQELTKITTKNMVEKNIGENEIKEFDFAWDNCPIVLTGSNLTKGGHSLPSDKLLNKGETIYFDFGIKVTFEDNESLYTDIQRMAYVLNDNEKKAPKNVEKVFNTLVNSIEDGIDAMKPGVKGYVIDNIVRQKILKEGYPDYNHATGHPVGLEVHDIGTVISIKTSKRANLDLVENAVYTLEPRVNISNGGSIEEMIQVTKYGGIPICETQKELYIVK